MPKRSPLAPVMAMAALVALGGCGGTAENAPEPSHQPQLVELAV
ncbi:MULTISPECIES: hypothetical protein [unclassified Nonomuraea]